MAATDTGLGVISMVDMAWLAVCLVSDYRSQRIPNLLILAALLTLPWLVSWSWWGVVAGAVAVAWAGYPGGDVKALAILGGLVGVTPVLVTVAVANLVTTYRLSRSPRSRPWMVDVGMAYVTVVLLGALLRFYFPGLL